MAKKEVIATKQFEAALKNGRTDFSKAVITLRDISLVGKNIKGDLIFKGATIKGVFQILESEISGSLDLSNAFVRCNLVIANSDIGNDLALAGCTFLGDIYLSEAWMVNKFMCYKQGIHIYPEAARDLVPK